MSRLEQIFSAFRSSYWATTLTKAIERMNNPQWKQDIYVHDWERYIPDEWQGIWGSLLVEAKLMAYLMAEEQAGNEEWE